MVFHGPLLPPAAPDAHADRIFPTYEHNNNVDGGTYYYYYYYPRYFKKKKNA